MSEQILEQQKQLFTEALGKEYVGCLFDIDGTLTVLGDEYIPAFMLKSLADLSINVPVAVCTSRNLSHTYEKLAPIFTYSSNPILCQSQWLLICESGSMGYFFDPDKKKYVEFHRVRYPYSEDHRQSLFGKIKHALGDKLEYAFINEVSMIFRPTGVDDQNKQALAARSHELAVKIQEVLFVSDPKGLLKIGDSGIGVHVFPAAGNKEQGTIAFAKYLATNKGILVGEQAKGLVVIGDQPDPGGNDETFLDGRFGTPFTVGEIHPENILPLPVFDAASGETLKGPEGTAYLVSRLHFRTKI